MTAKPDQTTPKAADAVPGPFAKIQTSAITGMFGLSTAWVEAMTDMNAEWLGFVSERIKEDVKTRHEMLHCKTLADLQRVQSKFIQKAIDQYQAETGKLVAMSNDALGEIMTDTTNLPGAKSTPV